MRAATKAASIAQTGPPAPCPPRPGAKRPRSPNGLSGAGRCGFARGERARAPAEVANTRGVDHHDPPSARPSRLVPSQTPLGEALREAKRGRRGRARGPPARVRPLRVRARRDPRDARNGPCEPHEAGALERDDRHRDHPSKDKRQLAGLRLAATKWRGAPVEVVNLPSPEEALRLEARLETKRPRVIADIHEAIRKLEDIAHRVERKREEIRRAPRRDDGLGA